jgi:MFS superfamily sulfate permease-like transporter
MHASHVREGSVTAEACAAQGDGGWDVAVERGPDWLFLRLAHDGAKAGREPLADRLLGMIRVNHAHRVVLELDRVRSIDDTLIDALAAVGSRVRDDGGLVRVCGLSDGDLRRLRSSDRASDLPHFESRSAAVGPRSTAVP